MDVILVGRHSTDAIPGINIVNQKNIVWSLDRDECKKQVESLVAEARQSGANVLLKNVPVILFAVLANRAYEMGTEAGMSSTCGGYTIDHLVQFGGIVSVPDVESRKAPTVKVASFADAHGAETCEEMVQTANSRAKTETSGQNFRLEVEQVMPFKFSHIEWL